MWVCVSRQSKPLLAESSTQVGKALEVSHTPSTIETPPNMPGNIPAASAPAVSAASSQALTVTDVPFVVAKENPDTHPAPMAMDLDESQAKETLGSADPIVVTMPSGVEASDAPTTNPSSSALDTGKAAAVTPVSHDSAQPSTSRPAAPKPDPTEICRHFQVFPLPHS